MTWNCNGLSDEKRESEELCNILRYDDIVFLLESGTSENSNLDFEGYTVYNFYGQFRHRRAKRSSGGLVLLYKEHLHDGIQVVRNSYDTICANNDFDMHDPIYEELDGVITSSELEACIKSLKHGKSCGVDNLLNEYFLEAGGILFKSFD